MQIHPSGVKAACIRSPAPSAGQATLTAHVAGLSSVLQPAPHRPTQTCSCNDALQSFRRTEQQLCVQSHTAGAPCTTAVCAGAATSMAGRCSSGRASAETAFVCSQQDLGAQEPNREAPNNTAGPCGHKLGLFERLRSSTATGQPWQAAKTAAGLRTVAAARHSVFA